MSALQPPRIDTEGASPAQDVHSDHSDDHYSSASEGTHSPVPITRVERVDDQALHGEVPGTPAYSLRTQDAVPDEIEIIPPEDNTADPTSPPSAARSRSRSSTNASQSRSRGRGVSASSAGGARESTPGGTPIPKTVVEKVDFKPSYGEVDGTEAKAIRMADAMPDEVRSAPREAGMRLEGRGDERDESEEVDDDEDEDEDWLQKGWRGEVQERKQVAGDDDDDEHDVEGEDPNNDDDFGDDFNEFAEGGDDDFGDFNDEPQQEAEPAPSIPPAPDILSGLPPLNLSSTTDPSEIKSLIQPYLDAIFPNKPTSPPTPPADEEPINLANPSPFLSDRSLSLWQQLVSPPPTQPPNWTKSRIRRMFLVSLGVPVDLDEILPPSKQKRLVLPSLGLDDEGLPRPSVGAVERLRDGEAGGDNASEVSLDSRTNAPKPSSKSKTKSKRNATSSSKAVPQPPEFDLNAATLISSTTPEALSSYSYEELSGHVEVLQGMCERASKVLEFWLERKDEGLKEKEALEGVIENLVGWVKRGRGTGR